MISCGASVHLGIIPINWSNLPVLAMKTVLAFLVCLLPLAAIAQPDPAVQKEAMQKLEFLVGNWEGGGWSMMGPGNRSEFRGTERVEMMLDGSIMVVEGKHYSMETLAGSEEPIHHAFGVFSYDTNTSEYRFKAYLETGMNGDYVAKIEENKIVWGFDVPQGTIRYTIILNEQGEWFEVGHFNPKGTEMWHQSFEMTMQKTASM